MIRKMTDILKIQRIQLVPEIKQVLNLIKI
jgi:hypothetical protein